MEQNKKYAVYGGNKSPAFETGNLAMAREFIKYYQGAYIKYNKEAIKEYMAKCSS